MGQFEIPAAGSQEWIAGVGGQLMEKAFLELGGGYLNRNFGGFIERGWGAMIRPGVAFPMGRWRLRVSFGGVVKWVTSGVTTRTLIEYIPYVGLGYEF